MSIDALPPLREIIEKHQLRAKKALGQNFLLDLNVTDKIARLAGDLSGVHVFEIGPGPGGLTRRLLAAGAKKVIAVEFDKRAVSALQSLKMAVGDHLEIVEGDALKTDLMALAGPPRVIVANLPYNIATPLLVGWLRQIREGSLSQGGAYQSMTLMFQKEVAERLVAQPGEKAYGRLSVLAQWLCDASIVYELPASAFTPPPKVDSCVVRFVPKELSADAPEFGAVETLTGAAFGKRRKMIRSSLKNYLPAIQSLGLDETLRAENLSVQDFLNIACRGQLL